MRPPGGTPGEPGRRIPGGRGARLSQRGDLRGPAGGRPGGVPSGGGGKGGLLTGLGEIIAAEVSALASLASGLLGTGAGLGVLEQAMRAALMAAGARLLEAVLQDDDGYAGPHAKCGNGHRAGFAGRRPKTVTTVLGPVRVTRAWYHCGECGHGFAPRDEQLGTAGTALSPGLTQMIARAGSEVPFGKAAALLADLAGVTVTAKIVERSAEASGAAARVAGAAEAAAIRARTIRPLPPREPVPDMLYAEVDGTGVPVRRSETEGRKGKGEDGQARTREIKLARFFTVSRMDSDGKPVTDPGSPSYVATFDGKDALAGLVEAEYLRRGVGA